MCVYCVHKMCIAYSSSNMLAGVFALIQKTNRVDTDEGISRPSSYSYLPKWHRASSLLILNVIVPKENF